MRDPGSRRLVRRVRVRDRRIALSFDDGPADSTEPILDLLSNRGAAATFFVVGEHVPGREDVLLRTVREGHEVGNHTWSHRRASHVSDDELLDELRRTNEVVAAVTGRAPALMRPPFFDDAARAARLGSRVGLERTALGYFGYDWEWTSPERIARHVVQEARPGAIIVLHDGCARGAMRGSASRAPTVAALGLVLPELERRGFEIVTVSELLAR